MEMPSSIYRSQQALPLSIHLMLLGQFRKNTLIMGIADHLANYDPTENVVSLEQLYE